MLRHTWTARGTSMKQIYVAPAEEYLAINPDKYRSQLL